MIRKSYPFGYSGYQFLERNNTHYIHSELLPDNSIRVIECDIEEKWMKVKSRDEECSEWIEMNLNNLKRGIVIDLNEKGDRWEGDSLEGIPFGYGCEYDSENQLIYKGFVFEGMRVCYGIVFYGDISIVEYEGGFYKGNRYGNGKLYDKKNELIYEGEWTYNKPFELYSLRIENKLKEEDIHSGLKELEIGENCCNELKCFKLIGFAHLKKLILHKNSLKNLNSFVISNNKELEIIEIEDGKGGYSDESMNTGVCYNVKNVEISSIF